MVAAAGVESGFAVRAPVAGVEVRVDRKLCLANSTQNCLRLPLALRPHFGGMVRDRLVAVDACIVKSAAFHLDGNDIGSPVIVSAAGPGIEVEAVDGGYGGAFQVHGEISGAASILGIASDFSKTGLIQP
jgi:hypothetical protein